MKGTKQYLVKRNNYNYFKIMKALINYFREYFCKHQFEFEDYFIKGSFERNDKIVEYSRGVKRFIYCKKCGYYKVFWKQKI